MCLAGAVNITYPNDVRPRVPVGDAPPARVRVYSSRTVVLDKIISMPLLRAESGRPRSRHIRGCHVQVFSAVLGEDRTFVEDPTVMKLDVRISN